MTVRVRCWVLNPNRASQPKELFCKWSVVGNGVLWRNRLKYVPGDLGWFGNRTDCSRSKSRSGRRRNVKKERNRFLPATGFLFTFSIPYRESVNGGTVPTGKRQSISPYALVGVLPGSLRTRDNPSNEEKDPPPFPPLWFTRVLRIRRG